MMNPFLLHRWYVLNLLMQYLVVITKTILCIHFVHSLKNVEYSQGEMNEVREDWGVYVIDEVFSSFSKKKKLCTWFVHKVSYY